MVTIGDVVSVIAAILTLGITSWALLICFALLFPNKVLRAEYSVEAGAGANFGLGLLLLIPCLIGVAALGNPHPLSKAIGAAIILIALCCVAVGSAGIGRIAARQIRRMDPSIGEYHAFLRGCAFLVTASILPVLGWLLVGPAIILTSLGAGVRAVVKVQPAGSSSPVPDPIR